MIIVKNKFGEKRSQQSSQRVCCVANWKEILKQKDSNGIKRLKRKRINGKIIKLHSTRFKCRFHGNSCDDNNTTTNNKKWSENEEKQQEI